MTHAGNKMDWCLKKAEREMKGSGVHRGLRKIPPSPSKATEHLDKADHYLKATEYLKKGGFSDISASTAFYAMYHCLLAIAVKSGYESRNQDCTFAFVRTLIEENKISMDKETIDRISSLDSGAGDSSIALRERFQYGTEVAMKEAQYEAMKALAKEVIELSRTVVKEN